MLVLLQNAVPIFLILFCEETRAMKEVDVTATSEFIKIRWFLHYMLQVGFLKTTSNEIKITNGNSRSEWNLPGQCPACEILCKFESLGSLIDCPYAVLGVLSWRLEMPVSQLRRSCARVDGGAPKSFSFSFENQALAWDIL